MGESVSNFIYLSGATKSPFVLGLGDSPWETSLPNCARMLLQKEKMEYEKVRKFGPGEYPRNIITHTGEAGRKVTAKGSLQWPKEFQSEQTHFA